MSTFTASNKVVEQLVNDLEEVGMDPVDDKPAHIRFLSHVVEDGAEAGFSPTYISLAQWVLEGFSHEA